MEKRTARRNRSAQTKKTGVNARPDFTRQFLDQACYALEKHHLPHITSCLRKLSPEDIWWRPNPASNSAGNLVLHLAGNVRQWIVSGLGGKPDVRQRDREFQEQGPIASRALMGLLQKEVREACSVLSQLAPADLQAVYAIQQFRLTGLQAVAHVMDHFACHCGQIIYLTKLKLGSDLSFTRLPGEKLRAAKKPRLSGM